MQSAIEIRQPDANAGLCTAINQTLANTAVATMLAQNLHWNVTGPTFLQLHDLFQQIYEDHFQAQDDLAERIKALDGHADGNLGRMLGVSTVKEHAGETGAKASVLAMLHAEEAIGASLKSCETLAAEVGDSLTEDLCIARRHVHEKYAWILRSHLR